ncbi:uncharacterized protein LOC117642163 isoform X1 [Thrips palmi]|uniref:Uncharacterized protein LOC117642163 isoform X1 n=1 Tax=Thrips palmi TaxID=161013 RepID=A0A6P8YPC8_THRPL|nr:uncharacterized protein LOC117642163 isoform X1 [Thrips palmi]
MCCAVQCVPHRTVYTILVRPRRRRRGAVRLAAEARSARSQLLPGHLTAPPRLSPCPCSSPRNAHKELDAAPPSQHRDKVDFSGATSEYRIRPRDYPSTPPPGSSSVRLRRPHALQKKGKKLFSYRCLD